MCGMCTPTKEIFVSTLTVSKMHAMHFINNNNSNLNMEISGVKCVRIQALTNRFWRFKYGEKKDSIKILLYSL